MLSARDLLVKIALYQRKVKLQSRPGKIPSEADEGLRLCGDFGPPLQLIWARRDGNGKRELAEMDFATTNARP
jgi:hypothetical protein